MCGGSDLTIKKQIRFFRPLGFSFFLFLVDFFLVSEIIFIPGLRVQDIAALIAVIFVMPIINEIDTDSRLKRVTSFITIYFYYLTISNLFFMIKHDLWIRHIFYVLKELEFIIAFFLTVWVVKNRPFLVTNLTKWFVIVNVFYGLYQVLTGQISYYGIRSIVSFAPSVSGNVFFVSMVVMFLFYLYHKKISFIVWSFLCMWLTVFTISKTYIVLIAIFFITFYLLEAMMKLLHKRTLTPRGILLVSLIVVCILLFTLFSQNLTEYVEMLIEDSVFFSRVIYRMSLFGYSADFRASKTTRYYKTFIDDNIGILLFGQGKGTPEQYLGVTTLGVDNQYLRSLIEMGIIGITLWGLIILMVLASLSKQKSVTKVNAFLAVLISYLAASVGTEVFQTTHPGFAFWFLAGVIYAAPMSASVGATRLSDDNVNGSI